MDFNETQTGKDAAGAVWMTDWLPAWLQPAELLAKGHSSRAAKTLTNAKAREIHFAILLRFFSPHFFGNLEATRVRLKPGASDSASALTDVQHADET